MQERQNLGRAHFSLLKSLLISESHHWKAFRDRKTEGVDFKCQRLFSGTASEQGIVIIVVRTTVEAAASFQHSKSVQSISLVWNSEAVFLIAIEGNITTHEPLQTLNVC